MSYNGIIDKYMEYLPVTESTPLITLLEGNTPLIPARGLNGMLGKGFEVFLKYEGLNPTGSFKDRGMTMAVSKALEAGSRAVMCASTGNTSASAAAFAARSGIRCIVLIPKGAIALGKLAQALIHGAQVIAIDGNFDDALDLVKEITDKYPVTLVNSLNPFRIEGQKTGAFEICDVLGDGPDFQCMPVGNAGNITAYWRGYKEYKQKGISTRLPRMCGFQAAGSAPIVHGKPIKNPETIATAIRIGNPASWQQAVAARDESGGLIDMVTDEEILKAYQLLAGREGVFVEPASAASVAGLIKLHKQGYFSKYRKPKTENRNTRIVCILTGHGLKDPDRAIESVKQPVLVAAKLEAVVDVMAL